MQAFFANFANGVASKMYQKKLQGQRARPGDTPSVKIEYRSVRRRSGIPKLIIIFPLKMARAQAEAI